MISREPRRRRETLETVLMSFPQGHRLQGENSNTNHGETRAAPKCSQTRTLLVPARWGCCLRFILLFSL